MGIDLGTISASVGLNLTPLKAGAAQAKGIMTGLDASMTKSAGSSKKAEGGLRGLANQLKGMSGVGGEAATKLGSVAGSLGTIGTIGVAAATVAATGVALFSCARAAEEVNKVTAQTVAVIKSTGGVANVSKEHVEKLGSQLRDLSGVDDEVVKSGENLLLTFRQIHNEVGKGNDIFDQATRASLDMSVAMKKDLRDSALKVGKALNDPIKGLTALRRYGVMFTDSQEKMIRKLMEAGDILGAQKVIIAELNAEFGGSAAALGNTLTGKIDILKSKFGDLKEAIGAPMIGMLSSQMETLAVAIGVLNKLKVPQIFMGINQAASITTLPGMIKGVKDLYGWMQKLGETKITTKYSSADDIDQLRALRQWAKDIGWIKDFKIEVTADTSGAIANLDKLKSGWVPNLILQPTVDMREVTAAKTAAHQGWTLMDPTLMPSVDMSKVTAAQTRAHQGWNDPPIVIAPTVDMSQVTAAQTRAHQGWTPPTVTVPVTGGGMSGSGMFGAGEADAVAQGYQTIANAFGGLKAEMDSKPFAEVEEAIIGMTAGNFAALADWRNIRGAYDKATASLGAYEKKMQSAEKAIESTEKAIEKTSNRISTLNDRLDQLSDMRFKGKTAADDKSFAQQQQLNKLKLDMMKAEDARDFNKLFVLQKQISDLERAKEEADLLTEITFDPLERARDKLLDPVKEGSAAAITASIKATQKEIAVREKQLASQEASLARQEVALKKMEVTFDGMKASVEKFQTVVDNLADYFKSKWGEASGFAEGGPVTQTGFALVHQGEYVLSRAMLQDLTKTPMVRELSAPSMSSSTSMNIYNFENLTLPNVTDGASFQRDLANTKLRVQVS